MDRRQFISSTLVGSAALAGLGNANLGSAQQIPRGNNDSKGGILDNSTRRHLIEYARFGEKTPASGRHGAAVSTHPLVSRAAIDVLREGGNAADAIVAASITQTVVEPHMTTLTGVFSMQYFDVKTGKVTYVNGSNNAPLNFPLKAEELKDAYGIMKDGRGINVPGFWGGVEEALRVHGSMSKKRLMAPAIDYARNGFEIHPFLWGEMFVSMELLGSSATGRSIYMPNRRMLEQGEKLYQHEAADLLERLADEGNDYFYHGGFAEKFCKEAAKIDCWVTPDDFAAWKPRWDEPVHTTYRDFEFYGAPYPDFGGQVLAEIFNVLEQMDLNKMGPAWDSGETTWKMKQVISLIGGENLYWNHTKTKPAIDRVLSKELAEERLASLPKKGMPPSWTDKLTASQSPPPGSNHLTVVDVQGNVATVLHSCMSLPWSNSLFADGISICGAGVHYASGMPAPGERIKARIGPNMFLKNGKPVLASGSPSVSLIENITQVSTDILDFGMSIQDAVNKPRFGGEMIGDVNTVMMEADMPDKIPAYLAAKGVNTKIVNPLHWSHGSFDGLLIDVTGKVHGCGDPRRTAMALAV